jgi:hypothetical protein
MMVYFIGTFALSVWYQPCLRASSREDKAESGGWNSPTLYSDKRREQSVEV